MKPPFFWNWSCLLCWIVLILRKKVWLRLKCSINTWVIQNNQSIFIMLNLINWSDGNVYYIYWNAHCIAGNRTLFVALFTLLEAFIWGNTVHRIVSSKINKFIKVWWINDFHHANQSCSLVYSIAYSSFMYADFLVWLGMMSLPRQSISAVTGLKAVDQLVMSPLSSRKLLCFSCEAQLFGWSGILGNEVYCWAHRAWFVLILLILALKSLHTADETLRITRLKVQLDWCVAFRDIDVSLLLVLTVISIRLDWGEHFVIERLDFKTTFLLTLSQF